MADFLDYLFRPSGYEQVTITDSATPTVPTDDQLRSQTLGAVGAITATRTMRLPLVRGQSWIIYNGTTGGFPVLVGGATGAMVSVAPGAWINVVCDGTGFNRVNVDTPNTAVVPVGPLAIADVTLSSTAASSDIVAIVGSFDGSMYNINYPVGFSRSSGLTSTVYNFASGGQQSVVVGGSSYAIQSFGVLSITWGASGTISDWRTFAPFVAGGGVSQVMLGNGSYGAVPAAALPAPAAGSKGGVALPASSTGLFYRDDGVWAGPGFSAISMPDANYTLSTAQSATNVLRFTGAITAYRYVTVPLVAGRSYWILNDCTGAYGLNFHGTTGGYCTIGNGQRGMIVCDGVGFYA